MSANGGSEIHKGVELLQLTRTGDSQQARDGNLAVLAACAEHGPRLRYGASAKCRFALATRDNLANVIYPVEVKEEDLVHTTCVIL